MVSLAAVFLECHATFPPTLRDIPKNGCEKSCLGWQGHPPTPATLGEPAFHMPCGTKFLRVLLFAILGVFLAIRKNKFPQIKLPQTFFPQKFTPEQIFSNLNSQHKNTVLRNRVCSITTCLVHSETTKYWLIAWKYVFLLDVLNENENNTMLGTGYFLKIAKINSPQEKPICSNRKN